MGAQMLFLLDDAVVPPNALTAADLLHPQDGEGHLEPSAGHGGRVHSLPAATTQLAASMRGKDFLQGVDHEWSPDLDNEMDATSVSVVILVANRRS